MQLSPFLLAMLKPPTKRLKRLDDIAEPAFKEKMDISDGGDYEKALKRIAARDKRVRLDRNALYTKSVLLGQQEALAAEVVLAKKLRGRFTN